MTLSRSAFVAPSTSVRSPRPAPPPAGADLVSTTPAVTAPADAGQTGPRGGFWLIAIAFTVAMAFASVPAPLYPLYQRRDGLSALTVTIVFVMYAVGVVASLLLAGHLSDRVGRKRILVPALGLEVLAALLLLIWPTLPALITARLLSGLAVGLVTATATAYLHDLHSTSHQDAGPGRFELVSTAANFGGLGAGTLVAGLLAQFATAPLRTTYGVFVVLILVSMVAVGLSPETVQDCADQDPADRFRYRPQRIRVASADRARYAVAAASAFTAFAIFGLFTSLATGFVAGTLHHPGGLLAGAVVFAVFGAASLAQTATSRLAPGRRFGLGLPAEAAGMVVLAAGMREASLAAFLVGGALAGAGAGVLFKSALGTVAAMAADGVRGEALAGLFLIAYAGLSLPTVGLGLATRYTGATTATLWFTGVLLMLLAATAALAWCTRRESRHDRSGYPGP
jgi:predicted MFS family arabinose efflux permease